MRGVGCGTRGGGRRARAKRCYPAVGRRAADRDTARPRRERPRARRRFRRDQERRTHALVVPVELPAKRGIDFVCKCEKCCVAGLVNSHFGW